MLLIVKNIKKTVYPEFLNQFRNTEFKIKWVGIIPGPLEYSPKEQNDLKIAFEKESAYPVFVPQKILQKFCYYYDHVIVPMFHNFVSYRNGGKVGNRKLIASFQSVNKIFVEEIQAIKKKIPDAIVLFNDLYFLFAPKLFVELGHFPEDKANLAYFIHSTFPSMEIFKVFPFCKEIMESLLCCNLIGFNIYEYARHFFSASKRLLGLEAEVRWGGLVGIIYKGRDVIIRVVHTGLSLNYIKDELCQQEYKEEINKIKKKVGKKVVVCGIDKLSPMSGIAYKLNAFENLLDSFPEYAKKVLLVQYCLKVEKWPFIEKTANDLRDLVRKINKKYPNTVIYEEYEEISNYKRYALFYIADVLLNTSLREGLILNPFEFIMVKNDKKDLVGRIIMSEFSGHISAVSNIFYINPYSIASTAEVLINAIDALPLSIEGKKFQSDLQYTIQHDDNRWLESIITDIQEANKMDEKAIFLGAVDKKILKPGIDFKPLLSSEIEKKYQKSVNRVILLDSEGTITPTVRQPIIQTVEIVSPKLLQILETLCADERNSVYILSGMPKQLIDRWYSGVPKLGLSAEYGYHYRLNTDTNWKIAKWNKSSEWKSTALKLFEWFKQRTDGSVIEIKDNSLVWVYKDCDYEFGEWQAKDLVKELTNSLKDYPNITVLHGKGFIDVKPKELEKGELAWEIVEDIRRKKGNVDFILAIGDDIEDEEMFKRINNMVLKDIYQEAGKTVTKVCVKYTCTVGKKPSHAKYYINDYLDVINLLQDMSSWSVKVFFDNIENKIDTKK